METALFCKVNFLGIGTGLLSRQQFQPTTEHSASLSNTETPYGSPPSHTTSTYSGNDYLSCSTGAPLYLHPSYGATPMERFNRGLQSPPQSLALHGSLRSLHTYIAEYTPKTAFVVSQRNISRLGAVQWIPLYLAGQLHRRS